MSDHIITDLHAGVLTIRIDRADKKNALTGDMYSALERTLVDAEKGDDVRAIVITGSGGCFSAGNDLKDFLQAPDDEKTAPARALINALASASLPLIAAVEGVAVGIGTTMLLHCDFAYASPDARFSVPFIKLGLVPEAGSSLLLRRLAGYQKATKLLMLGEPFDAQEALDIGLITEICDDDQPLDRAQTMARTLAKSPLSALSKTKMPIKRAEESVHDRVAAELDHFDELLQTDAAREIISAFMEKRAPNTTRFD